MTYFATLKCTLFFTYLLSMLFRFRSNVNKGVWSMNRHYSTVKVFQFSYLQDPEAYELRRF